MKFVKITTAGLMLMATIAAHAENKLVRVFDKDGMTVTVQPGPLPGTVILVSPTFFNRADRAPGSNTDGVRGRCSTLINESLLQRDLAKSPLQKDDILGFSCTNKVE